LSNVIRRAPRSGITGRLTHNQMESGGYQQRSVPDVGLRQALLSAIRQRAGRTEAVNRNRFGMGTMGTIEELDEDMDIIQTLQSMRDEL